MMKGASVEDILGYPVRDDGLDECLTSIEGALSKRERCVWLACINPHSLVEAASDPGFALALRGADWRVPDGAGIVLASRWLGGSITQRVTGSDIFQGLNERMNERMQARGGISCFFLGSTEETLAKIRARLARDYPGVRVAGTYSPPYRAVFSAEESAAMLAAIAAAQPDVLWVGMTAPKQEKWLHQHRDQLAVPFAAAVGAVFDFYAGNVKRSHPFFLRYHLEWLPRLLQEPRRLWRRNFVSTPLFLARVVREKLRRMGV